MKEKFGNGVLLTSVVFFVLCLVFLAFWSYSGLVAGRAEAECMASGGNGCILHFSTWMMLSIMTLSFGGPWMILGVGLAVANVRKIRKLNLSVKRARLVKTMSWIIVISVLAVLIEICAFFLWIGLGMPGDNAMSFWCWGQGFVSAGMIVIFLLAVIVQWCRGGNSHALESDSKRSS